MSARAFQRGRPAWPRRAVTCEADGSLRTVKRVDLALTVGLSASLADAMATGTLWKAS